MKRIVLSFAIFFTVYLVAVVALNLVPESKPVEEAPITPQIELQNPEGSPSAQEEIPLAPDL